MRIPHLDVKEIVNVFGGGPLGCVRALREAGFSVETQAVRHWSRRDRLPMDGFLMISTAHEVRTGKPLDINKYIRRSH